MRLPMISNLFLDPGRVQKMLAVDRLLGEILGVGVPSPTRMAKAGHSKLGDRKVHFGWDFEEYDFQLNLSSSGTVQFQLHNRVGEPTNVLDWLANMSHYGAVQPNLDPPDSDELDYIIETLALHQTYYHAG